MKKFITGVRNMLAATCLASLPLLLNAAEVNIPLPGPNEYAFILMPDTQYLFDHQVRGNFSRWVSQAQWVYDNAQTHKLRYVMHLGDITDMADHSKTHKREWSQSKELVEKMMLRVPVSLATGNHDHLDHGRPTLFDNYFGPGSAYARQASLGGTQDEASMLNTYHLFEAEGRKWMIIALEWGTRDKVIEWADNVLAQHPERSAIITMHSYMNSDNCLMDSTVHGRGQGPKGYDNVKESADGCADGRDVWEKLVRKHPNVRFVFNGHTGRSGLARRFNMGDSGNPVREQLIDFQYWNSKTNGLYTKMTLDEADGRAHFVSFSPYTGEVLAGPDVNNSIAIGNGPVATCWEAATLEQGALHLYRLNGHKAGQALHNAAPAKGAANLVGGTDEDASVFDGGRSLSLPFASAEDWSFVTWVRANGDQFGRLLSWDGGSVHLRSLPISTAMHGLRCLSEPSARLDGTQIKLSLNSERWTMLCIESRSGSIRVVADGEILGQFALPVSTGGFEIGASGGGCVAELSAVALFDRALSYGEIESQRISFARQIMAGIVGRGDDAGPAKVLKGTAPGFNRRHEVVTSFSLAVSEPTFFRMREGGNADLFPLVARVDQSLTHQDGVVIPSAYASASGAWIPSVELLAPNPFLPYYSKNSSDKGKTAMLSLRFQLAGSSRQSAEEKASLAYFPFSGGWNGGHVNRSGMVIAGSAPVMKARVLPDADATLLPASNDCILLVVGDTVGSTASVSRADLSTWRVQTWSRPASGLSLSRSGFSFVEIPWESGLPVCHYNASTRSATIGSRAFVTERREKGTVFVGLANATAHAPVLTHVQDEGAQAALLSVEQAEGGFIVRAIDARTLQPVDASFYFAAVPLDSRP